MSVQGFLLSGTVFVLSLVAALIAHVVLKHDPFAANKLLDLPDIRSDYQYVALETYNPNVILQTIKIGENDKEKELVILLHGFPETALISWYHQLGAFADSNQYFVLAPDMRGYNHSSKPENIMDYSLPNLIQDVHAIIHKYANRKKAHIIAHDWGAIVAWEFSMKFPDSVGKLIVMNGPTMAASEKTASLDQLARSWYVMVFQLPSPLPEHRFLKHNLESLKNLYMQWMRNKASKAVMDRLVQAWSEPNHSHSNINWYRALLASIYFNAGNTTETSKWKAPYGSTVKRPTLLLWGMDDACLVPETASACFELSVDESVKPQSKLITYADSGHFVQHEKSEEVTSEIFKFLKE